MTHISVPAAELNTRLDRLRCAMTEKDPAWSMLLLDNTLDMYYFTGTDRAERYHCHLAGA